MQKKLSKIKPIIINKIWGYEKWIYSTFPRKETFLENNEVVPKGPLIKIIKTNKPLSIQVHPDDKIAKNLENLNNGKYESWYVLELKKDSELILGMKNYNEDFIRKNIKSKNFINNLKKVKPKLHCFYNIPSGLVHGLGANITVLEVQQISDITYRYYDYNRLENDKPRELHLEKAILSQKNLDYKIKSKSNDYQWYENKYFSQSFHKKNHLAKKGSIVVDMKSHDCFLVNEDQIIEFKHFAIIYNV